MDTVPLIDLRAEDHVDGLASACADIGFFTVTGHDIDPTVVDAAWQTATAFFDLPLTDRMAVAMPEPGYPYGYSPMEGEMLSASLGYGSRPDLKESFAIGPVWPPSHDFADADEAFAWSPNLWPAAVPRLRPAWEEYYRAMSDLAARLLASMAQALDLAPDHFESLIDRHTSAMRALNYPGGDAASTGARWGASAHTDYGTLTILLADHTQPGLQVQAADGHWVDVVPQPGSFVVNLGDAMSRWTNDRWRSTMHRVMVPTRRRQSIAFFHNANWDASIECLPSCLSPGEAPRYEPIEAGPHLMHKFRSTVQP